MHSARIKRAGLSVYAALVISKYRDGMSAINAGRNYGWTDRVFIDLGARFEAGDRCKRNSAITNPRYNVSLARGAKPAGFPVR